MIINTYIIDTIEIVGNYCGFYYLDIRHWLKKNLNIQTIILLYQAA